MRLPALLLVGALFAAAGCAALADERDGFARRSRMGREKSLIPSRESGLCRVYVVPSADAGARRVGSIVVPALLAADDRLDEQSRAYACGLGASQAVKEEETLGQDGQSVWRMGIYRR